MTELTEKERKWFKSLERCLERMPSSLEILVQEQFASESGCSSEIHLMLKGVTRQSQECVDDLMAYDPSEYSIDSFTVHNVTANNHGY